MLENHCFIAKLGLSIALSIYQVSCFLPILYHCSSPNTTVGSRLTKGQILDTVTSFFFFMTQ